MAERQSFILPQLQIGLTGTPEVDHVLEDLRRQTETTLRLMAAQIDTLTGVRGQPTFYADLQAQGHRLMGIGNAQAATDAVPRQQTIYMPEGGAAFTAQGMGIRDLAEAEEDSQAVALQQLMRLLNTHGFSLEQLGPQPALSVIGVAGNAIAFLAAITAGANGNILRRASNALAFGAIDLADGTNAVSGVLGEANGGTGVADSVGSYTPSLDNTTNIAASTARTTYWVRLGNVVIVMGSLDADPTTTGVTQLGISLPIASNFTLSTQCFGVGTAIGVAGQCPAIYSDNTNDWAVMDWIAVDTADRTIPFLFGYVVL